MDGNYLDTLAIIISLIAILVSLLAYFFSKKIYKYQIFFELYKEYLSKEMFDELIGFREFVQKDNYVNEYIEEIIKGNKDIHLKRRSVKRFYQHLAFLHNENLIKDNLLFENWDINNLYIINKLIPIEEKLNSIFGGNGNNEGIENMKKLYKDAERYANKKNGLKHNDIMG